MRLKPQYDEPLSNSAFKFNLRPYVTVKMAPHSFNNMIAMSMTVMRFGMLTIAAGRLPRTNDGGQFSSHRRSIRHIGLLCGGSVRLLTRIFQFEER